MKNFVLFSFALVVLSGCGREQAQTYQVPKEPSVFPVVQAPAPLPGKGFDARLPAGWTEVPGAGMRTVSYSIEGSSVDFYLVSLGMGDLSPNVNLWRSQVGLPPVSPEAIEQAAEMLEVGGCPARYIEIYNAESGFGVVAAIVDRSPQFWYFTAKGSVDDLKAATADIRKFLGSVKVAK